MIKGVDCIGVYVCGLCHDGAGNMLWRRRGSAARDEHGTWEPGAGGSVKQGEKLLDALQREIREETSADILTHEYLTHLELFRTMEGIETHWVGFYYKCQLDPTAVALPDNDEADAMMWQSYHDAPTPVSSHFATEYELFKDHF